MLSPYVTLDTYFNWPVKTVCLWKMKESKSWKYLIWVKIIQSKAWRDHCGCYQICYNAPSSGYKDQFSHVKKKRIKTLDGQSRLLKNTRYLFSLKAEKYNFQACLSKKDWINDLANVQNQFTILAHFTEALIRTVLHVNWLGLSAFTEKLLKIPCWQIWGKQKTRVVADFF